MLWIVTYIIFIFIFFLDFKFVGIGPLSQAQYLSQGDPALGENV